MLVVKEIYRTLQGETTRVGLPCVIVRLSACDLRCSYCDTQHALTGGTATSVEDVIDRIRSFDCRLVTITGGEPLLQPETLPLVTRLLDSGFEVMVETNGAHDIAPIDPRAVVVMDMKCPSSGEAERNLGANLAKLKPGDEVKFVIATREDYDWARARLDERRIPPSCPVLFSWAAPAARPAGLNPTPPGHARLSRRELAELILLDRLPVRFIPQLHKVIWGYDAESV